MRDPWVSKFGRSLINAAGVSLGRRILAFESSCDELAVAILDRDGHQLLSSVIHSQIDIHAEYGGVVPEIASRDHVRRLDAVLDQALAEANLSLQEAAEAIAVTRGPGLVGCLLCGIEYSKGLAVALGRPWIDVNHLEAHLAAADLEDEAPKTPYVALLVSGGHSHIVRVNRRGGPHQLLGSTRDDAAGEAFDKTAKLLGLGYPGGLKIDRWAQRGELGHFTFPQPMAGKNNLDFSFSGLKTAARRAINQLPNPIPEDQLAHFCAAFQDTVVENLLKKAFRACQSEKISRLVLAGGVAANSELRARAIKRGQRAGVEVFLPSKSFCTDNAAMVARAGWLRLHEYPDGRELSLTAEPSWPLAESR